MGNYFKYWTLKPNSINILVLALKVISRQNQSKIYFDGRHFRINQVVFNPRLILS